MRWYEAAIHDLRMYESYKRSAENLKMKLEMLSDPYRTVAPMKCEQIGSAPKGGVNAVEDAIIDGLVESEEIRRSVGIEEARIALIERGLCALTPEKRLILEKFYVHRTGRYVDDLCAELNVERSTLYRWKDEALRQYTLECYGIEI